MRLDPDDLAQERALAELEGRDPKAAERRARRLAKAGPASETDVASRHRGGRPFAGSVIPRPDDPPPITTDLQVYRQDRDRIIRAAVEGGAKQSLLARFFDLTPARVHAIVNRPEGRGHRAG